MINNINQSPSFGSTSIPLKMVKNINNEYSAKVSEYFTVKGFSEINGCKESQYYADQLKGNSVAYITDFKNKIVKFVGFDDSSDNFIGRILKKICPEAEHVTDVKPIDESKIRMSIDLTK